MAINKGLALVSVADVLFFDPISGNYMGEGTALTDSSITHEMKNIETRGGYLNGLLFDIKYGKTVKATIKSATFKLEYMSYQTGTSIVNGLSDVYKFDECVSFTNGVGTTSSVPVGKVFVTLPNGTVQGITPTGSTVDIGQSQFSGQLNVKYMYNRSVESIVIDTKTQPMTLKTVLRVHTLTQDGEPGFLEITIPRFKLDGAITLKLTADSVSSFDIAGSALEVSDECGSSYYANVKFYSETATTTPVVGLAAVPNTYTLSVGGTAGAKTATANIIGLRNEPYSNVSIDNANITFESSATEKASVAAGIITAVAEGSAIITATYQGMSEVINVTVVA